MFLNLSSCKPINTAAINLDIFSHHRVYRDDRYAHQCRLKANVMDNSRTACGCPFRALLGSPSATPNPCQTVLKLKHRSPLSYPKECLLLRTALRCNLARTGAFAALVTSTTVLQNLTRIPLDFPHVWQW